MVERSRGQSLPRQGLQLLRVSSWSAPAWLLVLGSALFLTSCGGEAFSTIERPSPDVAAVETAPAAATPTTAALPTGLGDVVWARSIDSASGSPLTSILQFPPDAPSLTASVLATNIAAGSVVEASWNYNDTPLDAFATRIVIESSTSRRWLTFQLDRESDESWPEGTYAIEILLDGVPVSRGEVEVRDEQ